MTEGAHRRFQGRELVHHLFVMTDLQPLAVKKPRQIWFGARMGEDDALGRQFLAKLIDLLNGRYIDDVDGDVTAIASL